MNNVALMYRRFGEPESVLHLESSVCGPLTPGQLRVQMLFAPVNASDLIPITGAYRHRTPLPAIAGYEGVGVVIDGPPDWTGKRVLPLRGQGTWQQVVDCPADLAVPVPDFIDSVLAARAYINPLAAQLLLKHSPPRGKRVLLTAARSDCALLLGQWALQAGAESVYGIHRSMVHADRLAARGITPISHHDTAAIHAIAKETDIVFDATGGEVAEQILNTLPAAGVFVSYGLLSGKLFRQQPQVRWFHIRNYLAGMSVAEWQGEFREIWPKLQASHGGDATLFSLTEWRPALAYYREAGRIAKPVFAISDG